MRWKAKQSLPKRLARTERLLTLLGLRGIATGRLPTDAGGENKVRILNSGDVQENEDPFAMKLEAEPFLMSSRKPYE